MKDVLKSVNFPHFPSELRRRWRRKCDTRGWGFCGSLGRSVGYEIGDVNDAGGAVGAVGAVGAELAYV